MLLWNTNPHWWRLYYLLTKYHMDHGTRLLGLVLVPLYYFDINIVAQTAWNSWAINQPSSSNLTNNNLSPYKLGLPPVCNNRHYIPFKKNSKVHQCNWKFNSSKQTHKQRLSMYENQHRREPEGLIISFPPVLACPGSWVSMAQPCSHLWQLQSAQLQFGPHLQSFSLL